MAAQEKSQGHVPRLPECKASVPSTRLKAVSALTPGWPWLGWEGCWADGRSLQVLRPPKSRSPDRNSGRQRPRAHPPPHVPPPRWHRRSAGLGAEGSKHRTKSVHPSSLVSGTCPRGQAHSSLWPRKISSTQAGWRWRWGRLSVRPFEGLDAGAKFTIKSGV